MSGCISNLGDHGGSPLSCQIFFTDTSLFQNLAETLTSSNISLTGEKTAHTSRFSRNPDSFTAVVKRHECFGLWFRINASFTLKAESHLA